MPTGPGATAMAAPPPAVTITDPPAAPTPAAQDGTDDQGADE